jgi:hypothetical protein
MPTSELGVTAALPAAALAAAGVSNAGTVGCGGRPNGETVFPWLTAGAVFPWAATAAALGGATGVPPTEVVPGATVVVCFVVVLVVIDLPLGAVSDFVTVVVTLVPGATATGCATDEGSESKSMASYFACVCGAGFGCEQETRQSTKRRDTVVFIF